MKIAIDKGHNRGQDQGAVAIGNENTMNIATGDKVIAKLRSQGHEVLDVISQISNDVTVSQSLAQRASIANNWGADIYVSIHANATPGGTGVEVWIGSGKGRELAIRVCDQIASVFNYANRGAKLQGVDGGHLAVLNNTNMPAILVEQCFVDNAEDMNKWDPEIMANAIVAGITGQAIQVQAPVNTQPVVQPYPTYDETVPVGPNIYQIPGMPFYIEKREDGDMSIHLDRGNYITLRKGGAPEVYWNNNKGAGGSKRLF